MKFIKITYIVCSIVVFLLCIHPSTALKIDDVLYNSNSQDILIKINNPDNYSINANMSIYGYYGNNIDTTLELYNYTIPSDSYYIIQKKMIFNNLGNHTIFITVHTHNFTYTYYKDIFVNYSYNSNIHLSRDTVSKKIELDGIYFESASKYPVPFYNFMYVVVTNKDYVPHYINLTVSASLENRHMVVDNNKIVFESSKAPFIKAWSPKIYVSPRSKCVIPLKINFKYEGNYTLSITATDNNGDKVSESYNHIYVENPLTVYDIRCQRGTNGYCYSNWFNICLNNTAYYDVYGTLNIFLCKKEGNYYKIYDNKTINKYFLSKYCSDGYNIPIKLNTNLLNNYSNNFTIVVIYKTGNISAYFKKVFSKPVKINSIKVVDYPTNYYFLDNDIFYNVKVNVTNLVNEDICTNITITDIYNHSYSKEIELLPNMYEKNKIITFKGLRINSENLSHEGSINLKFKVFAITPSNSGYYISEKNESENININPSPPVYVGGYLCSNLYAGYPGNISFLLKKAVGRTVYSRVYITAPDLNNSAYFEEKYVKISTMKPVPVTINSLFLKEYNGPVYIHVKTYMGVRESISTMIVNVQPILECTRAYLNNYSVHTTISNRTLGYLCNEPIVGYPSNFTVYLKSKVPNIKNIKIWAVGLDEYGNTIKCSDKKTINIYGYYKKLNIKLLFNKSFEGYIVLYAKTGDAVIPLYYRPVMVDYPIVFNLTYNKNSSWANLTLCHNYPIPIDVIAKVCNCSKKITIYPYGKTTAKFWVGKNKSSILVNIKLLKNISPVMQFNRTFYFNGSNKNISHILYNKSINPNIYKNMQNSTKTNEIIHNKFIHNNGNLHANSKKNASNNYPYTSSINSNSTNNSRYSSKVNRNLFDDITGITGFKNLFHNLWGILSFTVVAIILLVVILLIHEPSRSKISSAMAFLMHKLGKKSKTGKIGSIKNKKPKDIIPPQTYIQGTIFSLGDVVNVKLVSKQEIQTGDLYIVSPDGNRYSLNIEKLNNNEYMGTFKIPENEKPGQYFIMYENGDIPIGMFIVIKTKSKKR